MKVLVLTHRFPYPPRAGSTVRAFNMIRHLARSHEVTVAAPVRSAAEAHEAAGIAPHCAAWLAGPVWEPLQVARMVACLPTTIPSSMGYFHCGPLARQVSRLAAEGRFDLVIVHCSSVAHYVARTMNVPKLLDFVDMDSQKWLDYASFKRFPLSAGYWLEGTKLEHAEKRLARRFDLCTTITRAELDTLEGYRTGVAADWFPNGVDSTYFSPGAEPHDPDTLCFVGRMDYYPNQEAMFRFCADVLPRIQARRPRAKLCIVGADPSPEVVRLGELPGVTVTGSVPDVRPWLHRSALMVAPLNIARGTQNKILEAMAAGVPVVSSTTAAGGVDAADREHFLAAGSAEEHAAAVLRILEDPGERGRLAAAGRSRVLTHHDWDHAMRKLDGIIERCLGIHRARSRAELKTGFSHR
jgi:sugar transferase (PEP-CTERM/EpsH1 system associated)